jgi:hypothetical protein
MKKSALIILMTVGLGTLMAQPRKPENVKIDELTNSLELRKVKNTAFKSGEKLTYKVHYGWMDAGEAVIEIKNSPWTFEGRDAYHVVGTGRSLGAFDWFFKVRDRFESYIDKDGIFPYRFIRDCDEGGYIIKQDYVFHPKKKAMKTHDKKEFATPEFVQDMISAFYYARTLDFSKAKIGDTFTVTTVVDGEIWPLRIKYMGTETIKVRLGKFECMKFVPVVQEGRIFKNENDLNVWITNDKNRIPLLVQSKILVGSIKMEVTDYQGLANPIAKVN